MQLGETIATYDIALALRGESGKFDVTSPAGETYHVTCKPNQSITNLQWAAHGPNPQPFLIRKVAEPVSSCVPEKTGPSATDREPPNHSGQSPFLVSTEDDESHLENKADLPTPPDSSLSLEPQKYSNLDLLYMETDLKSRQNSAAVCISDEGGQHTVISATCTTFNEFDAEIRRLHARLDEIRYRARKKFYQAHGIAPGA